MLLELKPVCLSPLSILCGQGSERCSVLRSPPGVSTPRSTIEYIIFLGIILC